jgi:hypothetical protein
MSGIDELFQRLGENPEINAGNAAERFFDSVGLMRGPMAPAGRGAFGFLAGSVVMYAARPSFAFNKDGSPKAWGKGSNAAVVPWWVVPVGAALVCSTFI